MWILLVPLIVAEVVFWGGLLFFSWRAFTAIRGGNWLHAGFWLVLIAAPFILYFAQHLSADAEEEARVAEVAAFERVPMPAHYPRQLDVHGFYHRVRVADLSRRLGH